MFNLCGFLGIGSDLGNEIISFINSWGWAAFVVSGIVAILSAGGLSWAAACADYIVATVESFLAENAWAKALIW